MLKLTALEIGTGRAARCVRAGLQRLGAGARAPVCSGAARKGRSPCTQQLSGGGGGGASPAHAGDLEAGRRGYGGGAGGGLRRGGPRLRGDVRAARREVHPGGQRRPGAPHDAQAADPPGARAAPPRALPPARVDVLASGRRRAPGWLAVRRSPASSAQSLRTHMLVNAAVSSWQRLLYVSRRWQGPSSSPSGIPA